MVRCFGSALLLVLLLAVGLPGLRAQEAVPLEGVRKALADASPAWELVQCDAQPSVHIEKQTGFRIVFRQGRRIYDPGPQQPTPGYTPAYKTEYTYIDLVLIPAAAAAIPPERVPWNAYPHPYFTRAVDMGTGSGYHWYGNTTIYYQEMLREKLGLTGGEDRIQLLVDGLAVKDDGGMTANSCEMLLPPYGEQAIPALEKAIGQQDNPWYQVITLGRISGEKATAILQRLYGLDQPAANLNQRNAAEYALVYPHHRKEAKREYLDMLRRQRYVNAVADICAEFGWTDTVPLLDAICAKPQRWDCYKAAFTARRALHGKPMPSATMQEILSQVYTRALKTPDQPDAAALEAIGKSIFAIDDKEAAAILAVDLATFNTKAQQTQIEAVRSLGRKLLAQLPAEITRPLLESAHAVPDENFRRELGAW